MATPEPPAKRVEITISVRTVVTVLAVIVAAWAFLAARQAVFWVFIASATNFAGMLFIGTTYAQVLRSPPYNLPSSQIVLINICAGVGALLAFPFGGVLVERVISRLARRNRRTWRSLAGGMGQHCRPDPSLRSG